MRTSRSLLLALFSLLLAPVCLLRAQEVVTFDTLTDLLAVEPRLVGRLDGSGNLKARVEVAGRTAKGDGGKGLMDLVLASSGSTNRGTFFRSTANPTYAWERVIDGLEVNVAWFGVKGDWDDNAKTGTDNAAALTDLLTWVQSTNKNSIIPSKIVFGSGDYATSTGLAPTKPGVMIVGSGPHTGIGVRGTSLVIIGTNTPGITLNGYEQVLRDISIKYAYRQPSTATESKPIVIGANAFKALVHNVSTKYGAYGLYCNDVSVSQVNVSKLWVQNYSIGGVHALNMGTTWTLSDLYIQNLDPGDTTDTHKTITGVSLSAGTNITFTCSGGIPPLLTTNRLFTVTGMDAAYNKTYVATAVTSTQVTCSAVSTLSAPVITSGGQVIFYARPATQEPFIVRYGNATIKGLDIEHVVTDAASVAQFGSAQQIQIDDIYFEHCYRSSGPLTYLRGIYGPVTVDSLAVVNSGPNTGETNWLAALTSDDTASMTIQQVSMRDIATNAAAIYAGRTDSAATNRVAIGMIGASETARAHATSTLTGEGQAKIGFFLENGVANIGDPNGTGSTVMNLYGGTGGASLIKMDRGAGTLRYGLALSTGLMVRNELAGTVPAIFFGDGTSAIWYMGPQTSTAPLNGSLRGAGGSGANVAGASLTIDGGISTGNATPGVVSIRTSTTGSSGSTAQSLAPRVIVSEGGLRVDPSGGATAIDASAALEVVSTSKGLLLPRTTATPTSAADGLIWYRSDTDVLALRANGATVDIATKPATETLTASGGTLTITAGKGPNQSSRWVANGNVTLAFSSLADNDGGRLRVWPATTNVTITLPNYASGPSGSTLTVNGGTGSTNYTEIVWVNGVESSTNRVSINALNYYR